MQEAFPVRSGADLVALREALGITQAQVAEALACSRITIHRWERPDAEVKAYRWIRYESACRQILADAGAAA